MGQAHMHLLVMQSRGVPCICTRGTRQGHLARPQGQVLKNELIAFQMNVFIYAIVSFCCAFCQVFDDIMNIFSYYFWECDKLKM